MKVSTYEILLKTPHGNTVTVGTYSVPDVTKPEKTLYDFSEDEIISHLYQRSASFTRLFKLIMQLSFTRNRGDWLDTVIDAWSEL